MSLSSSVKACFEKLDLESWMNWVLTVFLLGRILILEMSETPLRRAVLALGVASSKKLSIVL